MRIAVAPGLLFPGGRRNRAFGETLTGGRFIERVAFLWARCATGPGAHRISIAVCLIFHEHRELFILLM